MKKTKGERKRARRRKREREARLARGCDIGLKMTSRADYLKYLSSKWWRARKRQKLARAKYRCEKCGVGGDLHVHHRHYRTLGRERNQDLQVLCETCHRGEHPGWDEWAVNPHMEAMTLGIILSGGLGEAARMPAERLPGECADF